MSILAMLRKMRNVEELVAANGKKASDQNGKDFIKENILPLKVLKILTSGFRKFQRL